MSASAGNIPNRWCDSSTPRSPGMHWHALAAWRRPSHPAWRCNKAPAIQRARIAVLGTCTRNGPAFPGPDHSSPPHHWPGPNPTNHPSALDSAGTGRTLPVRQCKTVCSVPSHKCDTTWQASTVAPDDFEDFPIGAAQTYAARQAIMCLERAANGGFDWDQRVRLCPLWYQLVHRQSTLIPWCQLNEYGLIWPIRL